MIDAKRIHAMLENALRGTQEVDTVEKLVDYRLRLKAQEVEEAKRLQAPTKKDNPKAGKLKVDPKPELPTRGIHKPTVRTASVPGIAPGVGKSCTNWKARVLKAFTKVESTEDADVTFEDVVREFIADGIDEDRASVMAAMHDIHTSMNSPAQKAADIKVKQANKDTSAKARKMRDTISSTLNKETQADPEDRETHAANYRKELGADGATGKKHPHKGHPQDAQARRNISKGEKEALRRHPRQKKA